MTLMTSSVFAYSWIVVFKKSFSFNYFYFVQISQANLEDENLQIESG